MKKILIALLVIIIIAAAVIFFVRPFGYTKKELAEKYIGLSYNLTKEEAKNYSIENIDKKFFDKEEVKEIFTENGLKKAKEDALIIQTIGVAELLNTDVKVTGITFEDTEDGGLYVKFDANAANRNITDGYTFYFKKDGLKNKIDDIKHK